MLGTFLAEQAEKQAKLKQQRARPTIQTREVGVQCEINVKQTSDAAVQTDLTDVMEDLKQQVKNFTKIVAQLTEMKATWSSNSDPLDNFTMICQDANFSDIISETPPQAPPVPPSALPLIVPEPPVHRTVPLTDQNPPIQLRSPLSTENTNAQLPCGSPSLGPTDEQKRKVEAIVFMGTQMVSSAMACVNVLFSEEDLANGNTADSNGYQPLDNLKLRFLASVLRHKFESPTFTEQWQDVKTKINTRCRGKRRTVLRRLQKQINF